MYRATFPAAACGNTVKYYFAATATNGTVETDPSAAPSSTHSTFSGNGLITAFADNFETDTGWTVSTTERSGGWQRGVPVAEIIALVEVTVAQMRAAP